VDGEWKGMRGGKDSKSTSNSLSFSITKSVATKDKTSGGCYIPTHCPRLPANVKATLSPPIGQMDSAICDERGGVCVGGGVTGRPCAGGRVSLQYLLVSLPPRRSPPVWWRLTGACQEPEHGRATQYTAALADRRRSTAHEDDTAAVLRTVPCCN